jgi:hypothetical protein
LPTNLPRPRVKAKKSVFTVIFNGFMLGSALILTFMVLMQEERYAMGQKGYFADTLAQLTQETPADMTGETQVLPPD